MPPAADGALRPRLAVLSGSSVMRSLKRRGMADADLLPVPDHLSGAVAVESDAADAFVASEPSLRRLVAARPDSGLEVTADLRIEHGTLPHTAFAFRKDDTALRNAWDARLAALKASRAFDDLVRRFGVARPDALEGSCPL